MAVLGTQILATLIAVYGFLMPPLGWKWAGFVWAYALIWALVSDQVKLLAYRIFDPVKAVPAHQAAAETKPEVKDGSKPEPKSAPAPEIKAEPKPEEKDAPKPEVKTDPNPDGKDGPKLEAKAESKPETKDEPKPEVKAEPKPDDKDGPKPEAKAESKPETKDGPKPETKTEPKPETKVEPKPEAKPPSEVTPQLVKRVHELYEELGREEVRAVQDWEKKEQEALKDASDKAHK
jgi:H+-transporting ATPase